MGEKTEISWTDSTWNPVSGCTKVSSGCKFCYAERVSKRMGQEFTKVTLHPERLEIPLHWRKPRRIFVNSMSDLFHEAISDDFIDRAFAVMSLTPRHTYQILTKRSERMKRYMTQDGIGRVGYVEGRAKHMAPEQLSGLTLVGHWPMPHIWLGVSCENQEQADKRIPLLLQTPAAVRFVSMEPLLGPVDIDEWLPGYPLRMPKENMPPHISWVIVGGESGGPPERALVERCPGPGFHWKSGGPSGPQECRGGCNGTGRRPKPEALEWVRSIRDQCQTAGVAFHFKQFGGPRPKSGGRVLDGRTWDEYPS